MSGDDRVKQACAYLRMLLLRPGEYRTAWQRRAMHAAAGEIDYAAVAHVLHQAGGAEHDDAALVDTVRNALEGTDLSAETLGRFVDAFGLRRRQATRLMELMRGSESVRVISGEVRMPENLPDTLAPAGYETLSLHESHVLGPDGLPAEHQTIQVIRSTVDGLTSLPYRFDTDELVVEVARGGRVGDRVYRLADTLYAVDIMLTQPLARGQTALMQYRTTFFYKSPPRPEFRRGVLSSTKDLTVWVTFHRDRLPRTVWVARWDAWDHARVIEQEPVELDNEMSVHRRFGSVQRAIVGFHWEWD
ncbi:MAG TPA: hypothetical protein VFE14_12340 [Micromonosporaceae bacterium]|jgi:hypothetical protein|nr:hypothetical protein [Micromonosporaceae bacterium]